MKLNKMLMWVATASAVVVMAACEPTSQAQIDEFTGTWDWNAGSSVEATCPADTDSFYLSGNETISEGTKADLVITIDNCNYDFDVSGNDADIVSGQSCDRGDGITEYWSTFNLNNSNGEITATANGTWEIHGGECSLSIDGSMSKAGQ